MEEKKRYYKIVLRPISVPIGDFCWGKGRICGHFNNEGGYSRCDLNFDILKEDEDGRIPKPSKCRDLKEAHCPSYGIGWDSELGECKLCERENPDRYVKCKEINETIHFEEVEAFPYGVKQIGEDCKKCGGIRGGHGPQVGEA